MRSILFSAILLTFLISLMFVSAASSNAVFPFSEDISNHDLYLAMAEGRYYEALILGLFNAVALRMIELFIITVLIEYLVIYLFLGQPQNAWISIAKVVIMLNLITNPIAQIAMFYLLVVMEDCIGKAGLTQFQLLLVIEAFCITLECSLFLIILARFRIKKLFVKRIRPWKIIVMVLIANVLSFYPVFTSFLAVQFMSSYVSY